jgi:hypothetical protein
VPYDTDETVAVLQAAERAVDGLSSKARERLAERCDYVRLRRADALALIAAVDALRAERPTDG